MAVRRFKEAIHSGHFMVSDFEADAEDDEDLVVPPPPSTLAAGQEGGEKVVAVVASEDDTANPEAVVAYNPNDNSDNELPNEQESDKLLLNQPSCQPKKESPTEISSAGKGRWSPDGSHLLDVSLHKLFQNMSVAYRHKLTSPKWNRFRGLKLRWKDKIRLNNVIWRCWHLQFMKNHNAGLLCAFANPLEIDNHNKTEGSTLLEGKYWKRRLQTITKEYMRWRMFYKTRSGCCGYDDDFSTEKLLDQLFRAPSGPHNSKDDIMLHVDAEDADLLALFNLEMPDYDLGNFTLDTKQVQASGGNTQNHVYKGTTNADFIQPALVQLQPNLDDLFMDIDNNEWLTLPASGTNYKDTAVSKGRREENTQSNTLVNSVLPVAVEKSKTDVFTYREYHKEALTTVMNDVVMGDGASIAKDLNLSVNSVPSTSVELPLNPTHNATILPNEKAISIELEDQSLDLSMSYSTSTTTARPLAAQAPHNRLTTHCNSPYKHHSPKHRILYHRNEPSSPSARKSAMSKRHTPYELPSSHNLSSMRNPKPQLISSASALQGASTLTTLLSSLKAPSLSIPSPSTGILQSNAVQKITTPLPSEMLRSSDQTQRRSIQSDFETLRSLIPALYQQNTSKISKAALLHKAGDHLQEMKAQKELTSTEIATLKSDIARERKELEALQESLPTADGQRMVGRRFDSQELSELRQCFDKHVHSCTLQNWRYWVFASLFRPLFNSYVSTVSNSTFEDLVRSTISWMDQECNLLPLRRSFCLSLTELAINTNVLDQPECIPHESLRAVTDIGNNGVKKEDDNEDLSLASKSHTCAYV